MNLQLVVRDFCWKQFVNSGPRNVFCWQQIMLVPIISKKQTWTLSQLSATLLRNTACANYLNGIGKIQH